MLFHTRDNLPKKILIIQISSWRSLNALNYMFENKWLTPQKCIHLKAIIVLFSVLDGMQLRHTLTAMDPVTSQTLLSIQRPTSAGKCTLPVPASIQDPLYFYHGCILDTGVIGEMKTQSKVDARDTHSIWHNHLISVSVNGIHSSPKEVHIDSPQFSRRPWVTDPDLGSC